MPAVLTSDRIGASPGGEVSRAVEHCATGYAVNDRRSYDAWGVVRSQQSAGDPKLRYCGSLGHVQDDESGLIYMRARYYEPTSGRFVSEDPARDGRNWCVYCGSQPVVGVDESGTAMSIAAGIFIWIAGKVISDGYVAITPQEKAFKNFCVATLEAAGIALGVASALTADPKYTCGLGAAVVTVGACFASAILAAGFCQLTLLFLMSVDDRAEERYGGFTDQFYDLNIEQGKVWPWQ